jgi:chaperonin GroES
MQAMGLRPLHDRLIVERLEEDDVTKGGIIIPDAAKEKQQRGKVVAVGKGKIQEDGSLRGLDVKAGDVVLFGKYSGTEVKIDNEERLIIREDDVLAVVE